MSRALTTCATSVERALMKELLPVVGDRTLARRLVRRRCPSGRCAARSRNQEASARAGPGRATGGSLISPRVTTS